ncbi:uncharacterized protein VTP21DRAFT_10022 [Calcarisporiella thermophila]|uniref:uncharacterized protein n=1 Tax=Calcarisporiella thermophila TaxID=911321 RepID=UPI0037434117
MASTEYALDGLENRLKSHHEAFESLLKLIPARFYLPPENPEERLNPKYLKNKRKNAPKQEIKEASKKAKKAKLDPENNKSIEQLQQEKADSELTKANEEIENDNEDNNEKDESDSDEEEKWEDAEEDQPEGDIEMAESFTPMQNASINDLKARLHARISQLRATRNADTSKSREAILQSRLKRKQAKRKKNQTTSSGKASEEIVPSTASSTASAKEDNLPRADSIKEDGEVRFSRIELNETAKKKKGPKDAKTALKQVEAHREKLEKLKNVDKNKAEEVIEKEAWKKAMAMASGEKIKDDPKLLKKTIKREEQKKKKSEKQWKERAETVIKSQAARQERRQKNIQERIEAKKNKGKKKLRPGFEGSKQKKIKKK